MHLIQSNNNLNFKHIQQLLISHNYRHKHKQSILEGIHLVKAWHKVGLLPIMSIIHENYINILPANKNLVSYLHNSIVLADNLWKDITNLPIHDILWIIDTNISTQINLQEYKNKCGIILDNVQDSGNMGTIIRTAVGASYEWLLAIGGANIYSPKVLRSAMGGHVGIKIMQINLADLNNFQCQLNQSEIPIFLTTPHTTNSLYTIDIVANHIWVFGNEGIGIDKSWFDLVNIQPVNIPQSSNIESLNVASSSAICLYEKVRRNYITNKPTK